MKSNDTNENDLHAGWGEKIFSLIPGAIAHFGYTNHEGKFANRRVIVSELFFGNSQYHDDDQWLMVGYDLDRKVLRVFTLKDMGPCVR